MEDWKNLISIVKNKVKKERVEGEPTLIDAVRDWKGTTDKIKDNLIKVLDKVKVKLK